MSSTPRGPGRPPDDDKRDTRKEILSAAERMFASAGYEATSLRQIAGSANVDLSTLKYHYDDKANLFAEVFRRGHRELVSRLGPELALLDTIETAEDLRREFSAFVSLGMEFIVEEAAFVRLTLYRVLEDSADISAIEAEIEGVTVDIIESALGGLRQRGLIRDIDLRPFIVFIMAGLPMWQVSASTNPELVMGNSDGMEDWQHRAEAFIHDVVSRVLIAEN